MPRETCEGGGGGGTNGEAHEQQASTKELMRLSEALEEVDALRVSVRSRDAALQAQVRPPAMFASLPVGFCRKK